MQNDAGHAGCMYPSQTACGVGGADLWVTGPNGGACCIHNPLEGLLLSPGAAGKLFLFSKLIDCLRKKRYVNDRNDHLL